MFKFYYENANGYLKEDYDSIEECVEVCEQYAEDADYEEWFCVYDENNQVIFDRSDVDYGYHIEKINNFFK